MGIIELPGWYRAFHEPLQSNCNNWFSCMIGIRGLVCFIHLFFKSMPLHYIPYKFARFACDHSCPGVCQLFSLCCWAGYDIYFSESDQWYRGNLPGSILVMRIVATIVRESRVGSFDRSNVRSRNWRIRPIYTFKSKWGRERQLQRGIDSPSHFFTSERS